MINFLISHKNDSQIIEFDISKTLSDLKKHIIIELNLECKYIDINFKNETPIRGMGKFNLEQGIILRTFDNYKLERWNLDNKEIKCEIIEVDDYEIQEKITFTKKITAKSYKPPSSEIKSGESYTEQYFDINSESDFPPL